MISWSWLLSTSSKFEFTTIPYDLIENSFVINNVKTKSFEFSINFNVDSKDPDFYSKFLHLYSNDSELDITMESQEIISTSSSNDEVIKKVSYIVTNLKSKKTYDNFKISFDERTDKIIVTDPSGNLPKVKTKEDILLIGIASGVSFFILLFLIITIIAIIMHRRNDDEYGESMFGFSKTQNNQSYGAGNSNSFSFTGASSPTKEKRIHVRKAKDDYKEPKMKKLREPKMKKSNKKDSDSSMFGGTSWG